MTIKRPEGLACLHCHSSSFITTMTLSKFSDFVWRNMRCKQCGELLWWGTPLSADQAHTVSKAVPRMGVDKKTININYAGPVGTTLEALIMKSTLNRRQEYIDKNFTALGRSIDQLTADEKKALIRILEGIT